MNIIEQEILLELLFTAKHLDYLIQNSSLQVDVKTTLKECLKHCVNEKSTIDSNKLFEIESVLDYLHDELNTRHWSEVPLHMRQLFTCSSFLKCIIILKSTELSESILKKCLKCIDLGLLLGAPLDENELLPKSAIYVSKLLNGLPNYSKEIVPCSTSKRNFENEYYETFKLVTGQEVVSEECPSLENFNKNHFIPQNPVKLKGKEAFCPFIEHFLNDYCKAMLVLRPISWLHMKKYCYLFFYT